MNDLLPILAEDLSRSRTLPEQVVRYITDQFGYTEEKLAEFFAEKLGTLEEYEVDLAFSPMWTPSTAERLPYMRLLENRVLDATAIKTLIDQLSDGKLTGQFVSPAGETFQVPLNPVMVERFVHRLYLDKPINEAVYQAMITHVSASEQPAAWLLGRETVWHGKEGMLIAFLTVFAKRQNFSVEKLTALTDFVRTYRPKTLSDLPALLESLVQSCQSDLANLGSRGYHDDHLKSFYATYDTAHTSDEAVRVQATYTKTIALAKEILEDYGHIELAAI